jgi:AcrR family transcriptional regulator
VRTYGGLSADERIAHRRTQLIEAGLEEFGTRGFAATGVRDICRRAGLTDRYFYESFKDSSALFIAVFDRATARLFEVVARALAEAPPEMEAQARAVIEAYVRALADDPRIGRVVFVEAASAGPEAEGHMRTTLRSFAALIEAAAGPYMPRGLAPDALRFGALMLVGGIERVMIEWHEGELDTPVERIVDYLVDMLLAAGAVAEATAKRPRTKRKAG